MVTYSHQENFIRVAQDCMCYVYHMFFIFPIAIRYKVYVLFLKNTHLLFISVQLQALNECTGRC